MTNNEFKEGDLVQLKSGGPVMTIEKIATWNGESGDGKIHVTCSFFANDVRKTETFIIHELIKYHAPIIYDSF